MARDYGQLEAINQRQPHKEETVKTVLNEKRNAAWEPYHLHNIIKGT